LPLQNKALKAICKSKWCDKATPLYLTQNILKLEDLVKPETSKVYVQICKITSSKFFLFFLTKDEHKVNTNTRQLF